MSDEYSDPRRAGLPDEPVAVHDPLAYYQPLSLGAEHQVLARRLLQWLMEHCTCPNGVQRHAGHAFNAATFEICCAPPETTMAERVMSAKFSCIVALAGNDEYARELVGLDIDTALAGKSELARCYSSLLTELRGQGSATARFDAAVHDMLDRMREEQEIDPDTITMEQHRAIRRHTIGVPVHIACRRTLRGLFFQDAVEKMLEESGLLELAWEITAIANDLGSFRREVPAEPGTGAPVSLNFVWHLAKDCGELEVAIGALIDRHNWLVNAFRDAVQGVAEATEQLTEPRMLEYIQILTNVVDGNLQATRHLVSERYPGSERYLRRLEVVGPRLPKG